MKAAWKLAQRWFGWIAAAATVVGVVLAVRSQWDAIVSLDWGRSWGVIVVAALAFAVPPLVQAAAFWVSLRLLGVRAPVPETALVWGRAFVVRYAPTGALSVVYRVRERERLAATREQVLLATAYEHLGSLAAGALVCVSSFLLAGNAPPLLGVAIALPVAALAVATRPRFSAPLLRRLADHLGLEEPPLLRGRQLAAVVGINALGWLGTAAAVRVLVDGLAPGSPPNVAWLTGTYAVGYLVGFVVPFLPGGLGAREGALGAVYAARFGAAVATALVLTIRLVTTLGEVVAVGLIELAWVAVRMRRRRRILTGSCRRSARRPAFSRFSAASVSSLRARWPEALRARPAR